MALESGINVRLDSETKQRLDVVAESSGIKASNLIRHAVAQFLNDIEREGRLSISIELQKPKGQSLKVFDGEPNPPVSEIVPKGRKKAAE